MVQLFLSVSFLSIFTSGFRSVIRTGQRAVAAYGSQQLLSQKVVDAEGLEADEYTEDTITFTFKGGPSIDIDADTGGYNLQAAFSTGWVAGSAAAS